MAYSGRGFRTVIGCLLLVLAGLPGIPAAAQGGTQDIHIWTYENDGSGSAYDACYVLVGYSQEGCDLNGDGAVLFEDVAYGTYTVTQTRELGPGRYVNDFTITVNGGVPDFAAFVMGGSTQPAPSANGSRDLYIATAADGASYYDACYVLVGYSQIGCDVNRDGYVLFEDVAYGTYTVRQTADITPYTIADFRIEFNANTDNVFYAYLERDPDPVWTTDVHLITRDPADGELLRGACYELVGYSNVGCDENNDGQVTFDAIPLGDYTLHQVTPPSGYQRINDYTLHVSWWTPDDFLGLVVQQAPRQTDGTTDHVSLVFIDTTTMQRVASPAICAELIGGTRVGCDESLVDGQVDFLAVPHGDYRLQIHSLPAGYALTYPDTSVTVTGIDDDVNTIWYVYLTPGQ
jgi:hypothetical protein